MTGGIRQRGAAPRAEDSRKQAGHSKPKQQKQPFSFNRRLYEERRRIENAFGRLKCRQLEKADF
jgi:hypothetical protein